MVFISFQSQISLFSVFDHPCCDVPFRIFSTFNSYLSKMKSETGSQRPEPLPCPPGSSKRNNQTQKRQPLFRSYSLTETFSGSAEPQGFPLISLSCSKSTTERVQCASKKETRSKKRSKVKLWMRKVCFLIILYCNFSSRSSSSSLPRANTRGQQSSAHLSVLVTFQNFNLDQNHTWSCSGSSALKQENCRLSPWKRCSRINKSIKVLQLNSEPFLFVFLSVDGMEKYVCFNWDGVKWPEPEPTTRGAEWAVSGS